MITGAGEIKETPTQEGNYGRYVRTFSKERTLLQMHARGHFFIVWRTSLTILLGSDSLGFSSVRSCAASSLTSAARLYFLFALFSATKLPAAVFCARLELIFHRESPAIPRTPTRSIARTAAGDVWNLSSIVRAQLSHAHAIDRTNRRRRPQGAGAVNGD